MKVPKDVVDYREGNPEGRHCGNCVMFHGKPSENGYAYQIGICDLVEGDIRSDAVCDRWEKK